MYGDGRDLIGKRFKFSRNVPFISDFNGKPLDLKDEHFEKFYTILDIEWPHVRFLFKKKSDRPTPENGVYIRIKEFEGTPLDRLISTIYIDTIDTIRDQRIDEILYDIK